jgi:hypothetical protein
VVQREGARILTAREFQDLGAVPSEVEWFANIDEGMPLLGHCDPARGIEGPLLCHTHASRAGEEHDVYLLVSEFLLKDRNEVHTKHLTHYKEE